MSGILYTGPGKGQTNADWLIDTLFKAARGKGEEKGFAEMALRFAILNELAHEGSSREGYDKNGSRLVTAVYNHPESVDKDLQLTNYGVCPFVPHSFPVMHSFAVIGNLKGNTAGFVLDYFKRDIRPTKTIAFAQQRLPQKRIEEAAEEIFKLDNANEKQVYFQKDIKKGIINLKKYGKSESIIAAICEGELIFTGDLRPQNDLTRRMMENVSKYSAFTPEKYVLTHYDFAIDFNSKDTEATSRRKFKELETRVNATLTKKAVRVA